MAKPLSSQQENVKDALVDVASAEEYKKKIEDLIARVEVVEFTFWLIVVRSPRLIVPFHAFASFVFFF